MWFMVLDRICRIHHLRFLRMSTTTSKLQDDIFLRCSDADAVSLSKNVQTYWRCVSRSWKENQKQKQRNRTKCDLHTYVIWGQNRTTNLFEFTLIQHKIYMFSSNKIRTSKQQRQKRWRDFATDVYFPFVCLTSSALYSIYCKQSHSVWLLVMRAHHVFSLRVNCTA